MEKIAQPRIERIITISVVSVLVAAGGTKYLSSLLDIPVQTSRDPLFDLPLNTMWKLGVVVDVALAICLLLSKNYRPQLMVWAGSLFALYHVGIVLIGAPDMCPCLGSSTLWTGWNEATLGRVTFSFSIYMFSSGLLLLYSKDKWPNQVK